jgi:hypothetical protein
LLEDDSELFSAETVKNVRAWLRSSREQFEQAQPTPITIKLSRGISARQRPKEYRAEVEYCVGSGIKERVVFRHQTVEMLLRNNRHGVIQVKYRYLAARAGDRVILGPMLRTIQEARVN